MRFSQYLIPLLVFLVVSIFLAVGLRFNSKDVPSPLINQQAPNFQLPRLLVEEESFSPVEMHGKVWLLNVWASWCVSCRSEHQILNEFSSGKESELIGLNYKDSKMEAISWLRELGNPYNKIASDVDGSAGIDWGVYGVPETFVVDAEGVIRFKHIGPLNRKVLKEVISPLVLKLAREEK